ncbi:hypothetical protein AVCANL283_02460, partial [Campylobacter canadensis]
MQKQIKELNIQYQLKREDIKTKEKIQDEALQFYQNGISAINKLMDENKSFENDISANKKNIDDAEFWKKILQEQLTSTDANNEKLKKELELKAQALKDAQSKIEQAKSELDNKSQNIDALNKEIEK